MKCPGWAAPESGRLRAPWPAGQPSLEKLLFPQEVAIMANTTEWSPIAGETKIGPQSIKWVWSSIYWEWSGLIKNSQLEPSWWTFTLGSPQSRAAIRKSRRGQRPWQELARRKKESQPFYLEVRIWLYTAERLGPRVLWETEGLIIYYFLFSGERSLFHLLLSMFLWDFQECPLCTLYIKFLEDKANCIHLSSQSFL